MRRVYCAVLPADDNVHELEKKKVKQFTRWFLGLEDSILSALQEGSICEKHSKYNGANLRS